MARTVKQRRKPTPTELRHQATGRYVMQRRVELGFSQVRVAHMVGIEQSNVSRYEDGIITLSEKHLFKLAEILDMNPDDIYATDRDIAPSIRFMLSQNREFLTFVRTYCSLKGREKKKMLEEVKNVFAGHTEPPKVPYVHSDEYKQGWDLVGGQPH